MGPESSRRPSLTLGVDDSVAREKTGTANCWPVNRRSRSSAMRRTLRFNDKIMEEANVRSGD